MNMIIIVLESNKKVGIGKDIVRAEPAQPAAIFFPDSTHCFGVNISAAFRCHQNTLQTMLFILAFVITILCVARFASQCRQGS